MLQQIYTQLKTPKTLDEIYQRLNEIGILWNKAQIQLFLEMDKKMIQKGNKWKTKDADDKEIILEIIDKVLENKPIVSARTILKQISSGVKINKQQIVKIAEESGKYISTNGKTIKFK